MVGGRGIVADESIAAQVAMRREHGCTPFAAA